MEHEPPPEDYSQLYWRCLHELARRRLKFASRRAVEKILALTYGREIVYGLPSRPDVRVASFEVLADAIGTLRGNLHGVLNELVGKQVLQNDPREDWKTWWVNDSNLWQVECYDLVQPGSAQRVAAAESSILRDDQQRTDQRLLRFARETTDAEVQAEAARENAENFPNSGLPSASGNTETGRSKFQNDGVLKNRTRSKFQNEVVLNFRTPPPDIVAPALAGVRPGYQALIKPGNQVGRGTGEGKDKVQLDQAGRDLLDELEEFCGAGTPKQRLHWGWRIWRNRHLVERALREVQLIAREGQQSIPSRAGYVKYFWRLWGGDGPDIRHAAAVMRAEIPADVPRVPAASSMMTPLTDAEWEQQRELVRRTKEEFVQQFGNPSVSNG